MQQKGIHRKITLEQNKLFVFELGNADGCPICKGMVFVHDGYQIDFPDGI
jgi:general stress protein 26